MAEEDAGWSLFAFLADRRCQLGAVAVANFNFAAGVLLFEPFNQRPYVLFVAAGVDRQAAAVAGLSAAAGLAAAGGRADRDDRERQ